MCYLLVAGTFLCDLRVSDRFSEYKENPENTGFSGFVALFRYSVELSLAELWSLEVKAFQWFCVLHVCYERNFSTT